MSRCPASKDVKLLSEESNAMLALRLTPAFGAQFANTVDCNA
ncbi:hypothetical protein AWB76_07856 [Caballeronia temeraria]|uniref:Uncharacterized protein n=1 Tax=Caballeronia temeraria TaxID=1777137 RepID=A0A158E0N9_9BURK|nr:hypothetical protein AWB76_07856 [Caballeronia temeraria]